MDPLDQRIAGAAPAPLSDTDREHLAAAVMILAIEARDANERAGSSMGGLDDLARGQSYSQAARTIGELIDHRRPR
jgi:hypothetical protein